MEEERNWILSDSYLRIFIIVIIHDRLPVAGRLSTNSALDYLSNRYLSATAEGRAGGAPATDRFAGRHQHRVGRAELTLLAVMDTVQEVHQHTDGQPDEKAQPGQEAQMHHQLDVAEDAQCWDVRYERYLELQSASILMMSRNYNNT